MDNRNQLYISNFPFSYNRGDILECLGERPMRFAAPVHAVPQHRGQSHPYRRMSAFVHWNGLAPPPSAITGFLPKKMADMGWDVPLKADPARPASWLKCVWGQETGWGAGQDSQNSVSNILNQTLQK